MGGHSSGDVFATGADMTETQRTNNISVDQVAANALGHHTRFASLVLATLMLESEHSQSSETWNYANYALGYKGATQNVPKISPVAGTTGARTLKEAFLTMPAADRADEGSQSASYSARVPLDF